MNFFNVFKRPTADFAATVQAAQDKTPETPDNRNLSDDKIHNTSTLDRNDPFVYGFPG